MCSNRQWTTHITYLRKNDTYTFRAYEIRLVVFIFLYYGFQCVSFRGKIRPTPSSLVNTNPPFLRERNQPPFVIKHLLNTARVCVYREKGLCDQFLVLESFFFYSLLKMQRILTLILKIHLILRKSPSCSPTAFKILDRENIFLSPPPSPPNASRFRSISYNYQKVK